MGTSVTDNTWIYAPPVEKWLAAIAGPLLGVDTKQYTIFLVNGTHQMFAP
jgi:hypothetical protein